MRLVENFVDPAPIAISGIVGYCRWQEREEKDLSLSLFVCMFPKEDGTVPAFESWKAALDSLFKEVRWVGCVAIFKYYLKEPLRNPRDLLDNLSGRILYMIGQLNHGGLKAGSYEADMMADDLNRLNTP